MAFTKPWQFFVNRLLTKLIGLDPSRMRRATLTYEDLRQAGPVGNSNSASDSGFMVMLETGRGRIGGLAGGDGSMPLIERQREAENLDFP